MKPMKEWLDERIESAETQVNNHRYLFRTFGDEYLPCFEAWLERRQTLLDFKGELEERKMI